MIALTPVVSGVGEDGPVSSPFDLEEGGKLQIRAATDVARTTVRMLAAGVATVDVQALISRDTGAVTFVDMTEARVLSSPPSPLDMATAVGFVTEMMILIPESSKGEASGTMLEELRMLDNRGVPLSKELCDLLR